jgi:hypothetical protein
MDGDDIVIKDGSYVVRLPQYEKRTYKQIFYNPNGYLFGNARNDFFEAAKSFAESLTETETFSPGGARAALFLARHYLELALKSIVLGLRSLERRTKNAPSHTVIEPSGHPLLSLWNEITNHFPKKMGGRQWRLLDVEFVDQFVRDFDSVDPSSERFRYGREKGITRDSSQTMMADWAALKDALVHVYEVLDWMHSLLIEQHGDNADWEAEMNSW